MHVGCATDAVTPPPVCTHREGHLKVFCLTNYEEVFFPKRADCTTQLFFSDVWKIYQDTQLGTRLLALKILGLVGQLAAARLFRPIKAAQNIYNLLTLFTNMTCST